MLARLSRALRAIRLVRGPLAYNADGLATRHNSDFLDDPRFREAYEQGRRTGSWGDNDVRWRAYIACWAGTAALQTAGDFVECGVNRGGLARAVIEYTGFRDVPRRFFLLDTFEGLSDKYISPEERARGVRAGGYTECYADVQRTFGEFPNVAIIRGTVPDTLPMVTADRVAYLSIDMNCVQPEIEAAEFFWNRVSPGGVVLLDDYGWRGHELQKAAFDTFAAQRQVPILRLPTGQALIFKPR